jgi:hypothetical protein
VVPVPSGATTGPVTVTVNSLASNGPTFIVTTMALPAPWLSQDVGNPVVTGQASYSSSVFSVSGAGADIWGASDQFRFVYQTLDGDGAIIAYVGGLQQMDPWTKAGLMIREDLTGGARNAAAVLTPANGMTFQSRAVRSAASTSSSVAGAAPQWIALVRSGSSLSGYYLANNTTWTLIGGATITLPTRVYVGLAVTSHNPSVTANATFVYTTVIAASASSETSTTAKEPASLNAAGSAPSVGASPGSATIESSRPNKLVVSDYDGDGSSDIATYRPSTGEWQVLVSGTRFATGIAAPWGTNGDLRVPGDYDADGKTDLAYYRPSTGTWSILESSTKNTSHRDVFIGGPADVPVPGDYDGDGVTDVAVYSPATGQWSIFKSSTDYKTMTTLTWGSGSDVPVPGDYDGDGKTDLAFYQPASGQWKILQSSTDYATNVTLLLGVVADIPVPADYDGDGIADVAVFRRSEGTWLARLSTKVSQTTTLATMEAGVGVPLPADYDGDGKADLAVFIDGTWNILRSSAGYKSGASIPWGLATDVPVLSRPQP